MDEDKGSGVIGTLIIVAIVAAVVYFFMGGGKYEGETAEYWFNAYDEAAAEVDDYKAALEEANSNIEDANSMISDVQDSSDIEELRDALDSLSQVDTVSDPY